MTCNLKQIGFKNDSVKSSLLGLELLVHAFKWKMPIHHMHKCSTLDVTCTFGEVGAKKIMLKFYVNTKKFPYKQNIK
jgi:hypothetical protein